MKYIRNIFTQDLRDGKQIAFPKEPSNVFFNFNYQTPDPDRQISFKFREKDTESAYISYDNRTINTRLYAAGSESRIDGQLKQFLRDTLNARVDDIIVFKKNSDTNFEFEFIPQSSSFYSLYQSLLSGKNHEVVISTSEQNNDDEDEELSSEEIISLFAKWLNAKTQNNYFDNNYDRTVTFLNRLKEKYIESFTNDPFDVEFNDIDSFNTTLNTNIWNQTTDFWSYSESTSNHQPRAILNKDNYQTFLKELKEEKHRIIESGNIIYYGAPGTGKSYRVDQVIKHLDPKYFERVTFHPDYDHASFVGGYRPKTVKNEGEQTEITYEFVPQAFASIYVRAWKDLKNPYYLVIEEINRGNCAEIFGDIFQLLDRNSGYTVSPSEEFYQYLLNQFGEDKKHEGIIKGLKLPPNLSIYATMNTSDQSLFPMDSAFKRRWDWEYIPICYDKQNEEGKENASYNFELELPDGTKYSWRDFISKINNNHIKNNPALGMDKCIGNYFIKPDNKNSITLKPFINKVIFYLWNDVFKDEDNAVFEMNGSYEDFFPTASNGLQKVKELFLRIDLQPVVSDDRTGIEENSEEVSGNNTVE